jgi:hypothetical protein
MFFEKVKNSIKSDFLLHLALLLSRLTLTYLQDREPWA